MHKYKVGQTLDLLPNRGSSSRRAGECQVVGLLPFEGQPPHRRIAMVWRKSSAMDAFLQQLAEAFRQVPAELLQPPKVA